MPEQHHCRICRGRELTLILDLGRTALANRFLSPELAGEPEPTYPLRLVRCGDCGLVQIDETVPPQMLFGHYLYLSQTSDAVRQHVERLARDLIDHYGLRAGDLVLEVASNDGTLLKAFAPFGVRTLGIEPAANIAEMARAAGVETITEFFSMASASRLRQERGPAKLILARHVLAHVADLPDFVCGLRHVLDDDGLVVIECPHLLPFFQNLEYDTVYHEHLCYFSVRVLDQLFEKHGLELLDVEEVSLHGGSILVTAQKRNGPHFARSSVEEIIAREDMVGLHRDESWAGFAERARRSRNQVRAELRRLRAEGKTIAGYGAAAKGMTLLAYCGLDYRDLQFVADKSPLKQGRLTPGHHIPVSDPQRLLDEQPDVVLLLAWNFAAEIAAQQAEYLRRGGRFLLPLPEPHYWAESSRALETSR